MLKRVIFFLIIIVVFSDYNLFSEEKNEWKFGAQFQLRTDIDGRDFSNQTRALNFTTLRTRFSVSKDLNENVGIFIQAQDSRLFGSEPTTLTSIDNLDIHQAYVKLSEPLSIPVDIKVGRFEVAYGTQRFLGAVDWHYVARTFDGVVFSVDPGVNIDLFALTQKNPQIYMGNGIPLDTILPENSFSVYGLWAKKELNKSHVVDLFGYYEANRMQSNGKDSDLGMLTTGANYCGTFDNLKIMFEGGYQTGKNKNKNVSAYLVSLYADYKLSEFSFIAGADLLSGTAFDDTVNYNSFAPTYGSHHKIYGLMDYFINIPLNTNNLGLRDFYGKLKWIPEGWKFEFGADFHLFMSDKPDKNGKNSFGNEFDLTVKYNFTQGTTISWGGSIFMPSDLMKTKFGKGGNEATDTAFWTYLMITANIN